MLCPHGNPLPYAWAHYPTQQPRALAVFLPPSPWALLIPFRRGPVDHHGPDHCLHPDGARGEVRLQAQCAPAAGRRH